MLYNKHRNTIKRKTYTLNGNFGSLVKVILNVTLLPEAAGAGADSDIDI